MSDEDVDLIRFRSIAECDGIIDAVFDLKERAAKAEREACEATLVELRNSTMCVCDGEGNLVGSYLQYEHDTIDKAIGALRARGKEGSDADKT